MRRALKLVSQVCWQRIVPCKCLSVLAQK